MLNELERSRKRRGAAWDSPAWESPMGRVGTIVSADGNGTYTVSIGGASYRNVPAATGPFHPNQTVRVVMEQGVPVIVA